MHIKLRHTVHVHGNNPLKRNADSIRLKYICVALVQLHECLIMGIDVIERDGRDGIWEGDDSDAGEEEGRSNDGGG